MKSLMVIFERFITKDGTRLRIGGIVSRDVAHFHGVPHGAVQVAVAVLKNGKPHILLHKRSIRKKTSPNKWDICGGQIIATKDIIPTGEKIILPNKIWEDQELIDQLFAGTALREVNEEVQLLTQKFTFEPKHIKCFGGPGAFEYGFKEPNSLNKEFSALYVSFIPPTIKVLTESEIVSDVFEVKDAIGVEGNEEVEEASDLKVVTLSNLIMEFTQNPSEFADGVSRVLLRVINEPGTLKELTAFLDDGFRL